jgi:DNA excision repair protein ERCC-2
MLPTTARYYNQSIALERGPLLYSLKLEESWTRVNADKPHRELPHGDFEVRPASPWNYALLLDENHAREQCPVRRTTRGPAAVLPRWRRGRRQSQRPPSALLETRARLGRRNRPARTPNLRTPRRPHPDPLRLHQHPHHRVPAHPTPSDLAAFFKESVTPYLDWIRDLHQWRQTRNETIRTLHFPFARYRPGQRQIAVATYRTLIRGGRLFIEAPTGIGKTASVLFPALKAIQEGHLDQIFYLTARTVGRLAAGQALDELRAAGLRLRSLTLTARDKVCVQDGLPCNTTTCPLALGYYNRRHQAMRAALNREKLTRQELDAVGRSHQVCPHELSLDLSTWVDVVICDYNYVFDPNTTLRRHFTDAPRPCAFLIDEAHNLVDRARDMFSATLADPPIREVRRRIARSLPQCARTLSRLQTALRKLAGASAPPARPDQPASSHSELNLFPADSNPRRPDSPPTADTSRSGRSEHPETVFTRREPPADLIAPLDAALKAIELELVRNRPADARDRMLNLFFHLLAFRRTADLYDERYATLIEPGPDIEIRLLCLDPSFLLRQALDRGRSAVLFSATLSPIPYYQTLLGGGTDDPHVQLPSPFASNHLAVLVHDRVRTELKARADSLDEVVRAVGSLVEGRRGNYLVFFPSYQYLAAARDRFQTLYPHLLIRTQQPGMAEADRESFLAAFRAEPEITQVGFVVMGGIFGEGIDLVGDRLIGAAIVGVGMPQLSPERDLIRDHFTQPTRSGFDYAYTFPGMNRVLQAIGRVIRSETDRGIVLLLDSRFAQPRYRQLFPTWWLSTRVASPQDIQCAVAAFWTASP